MLSEISHFVGRRVGEAQFFLERQGVIFSRLNPFSATWKQTEKSIELDGKKLAAFPLSYFQRKETREKAFALFPDTHEAQIYPVFREEDYTIVGAALIDRNEETPVISKQF
ncbi:MAG: hypothetical protein UV73_C0008G0006 [Candidatus Gottesmanbacteria bacterium GW2011_GWA2_43_14]|uniref:Uncharacterized protein n=1 Tax=Candidatus Gottesmanbacteria bacterium GW2011_GWA2_43_14 TaxID=1618443 RepID=A0A0G1FR27_9BACT|nr:MAG: hypothetical protein UV73_C0008G0006 [Candidatus Gottesmanbacteria bacterium GW2011_GWA2_43_14]